MNASGKFVLRLPPELHIQLKLEAEQRGCSLNQLVLNKIRGAEASSIDFVLQKIVRQWSPMSIILFGSTARGQARRDSDVDLLIVLTSDVGLNRDLYRRWDQIFSVSAPQYSPQFVHLPVTFESVGGIWLEAALEGHILYSSTEEVPTKVRQLKDRIARGDYIRKVSHGHGYWVKREE